MKSGKFITLYGINNIGKTTHAKLLVKKLQKKGYKSIYIKYPVYDIHPSGDYINKILRNSDQQKISEDELQLWFVLNRYQFQDQLKKYLDEGIVVVAEDYIGTGIAWGTAKDLDEEWMENINKNLIKEDLSIFIEGKRDLRAKESKHVHEQNEDLIKKCTEIHLKLADKYSWKRVKLQSTIESTAKLIWDIVDDFLA